MVTGLRRAAPGRPRERRGFSLLCTCAVALSFLVFGVHRVWVGGVALPHEYLALAHSGVPVSLVVDRCATGMHGDRSFECEVSTVGTGQPHTWVYPNDVTQFRPYSPGTTVPALGDPADPTTVYTVRDVREEAGAGWTAPGTEFAGLLVLAGGVLGLAGWVRGTGPRGPRPAAGPWRSRPRARRRS